MDHGRGEMGKEIGEIGCREEGKDHEEGSMGNEEG